MHGDPRLSARDPQGPAAVAEDRRGLGPGQQLPQLRGARAAQAPLFPSSKEVGEAAPGLGVSELLVLFVSFCVGFSGVVLCLFFLVFCGVVVDVLWVLWVFL